MLDQQVPHQANALAHGERRGNGANAQPFQAAQEEEGHARRNSQAGYIKADFNARVRHLGNVRQLPREQVGGHNGQPAPVGKRNAKADQQVADYKIHHPPGQCVGQNIDPQFVHIQQLTEHKAHYKAEQVRPHPFAAHNHQAGNQSALEQVGPGSQRKCRERQRKRIRHAGNGRNSRAGVQHQYHAKAVDQYRNDQRQLPTEQCFSALFLFHQKQSPLYFL